jgi:dihydropteroate synthase
LIYQLLSNFRETNPGWIMESKVTPFSSKKTLNFRGKLYHLDKPLVMGILNVTPDSFYDGNRFNSKDALILRLQQMINEGADIIDIGGCSSRPGADHISIPEEIERVIPAIETARSLAPELPLSIDTFRSTVAKAALDCGVDMVNDISGGSLDPLMFQTVAERGVPYVLMHMRGDPGTMSAHTDYENLILQIMKYFVTRIEQLTSLGVKDILVDPGFGFAKTTEQNYVLLKNLGYFKELNVPLLVGLSRKSMIYKTLNTSSDEALTGTCVLNTMALMNGAAVLRVHDIRAARETISLFKQTYP